MFWKTPSPKSTFVGPSRRPKQTKCSQAIHAGHALQPATSLLLPRPQWNLARDGSGRNRCVAMCSSPLFRTTSLTQIDYSKLAFGCPLRVPSSSANQSWDRKYRYGDAPCRGGYTKPAGNELISPEKMQPTSICKCSPPPSRPSTRSVIRGGNHSGD